MSRRRGKRTAGGGVSGAVSLRGFAEFEKKLRALPGKVARKVVRQALREGAKIIQAEAKARVPVDSGKLKKSIKVRAAKSRKKGTAAVVVQTGQGDFKGETFYGAFLEYGHKLGARRSSATTKDLRKQAADLRQYRKTTGDKRWESTEKSLRDRAKRSYADDQSGRTDVPPRPYMRPAFDSKKEAAERTIAAKLAQGITEAAKG